MSSKQPSDGERGSGTGSSLTTSMNLSEDLMGSEVEMDGAVSPSEAEAYSWGERARRGLAIVILGEWRGIGYSRRDRVAVVTKAIAVLLGSLAVLSLSLDRVDNEPEQLWTIQVWTRSLLLAGIDQLAQTLRFTLDNEWTALLVVVIVLLAYRRR